LINCGVCALTIAALSGLGARSRAHGSASVTGGNPPPGIRALATGCLPSHRGYLRARLRGANDLEINWHDGQMQCDGDVRPDNHGIRLTFAGRAGSGDHRIRFVFGIEAPAAAGVTHNVPAGVTVIFEGERRLYSTRGAGKCTVDDLQQEPIGGVAAHIMRVSARGFCIGEATAVGAQRDELLLSTFDFQGRVAGVSAGSAADRTFSRH
jgi:hypothetical protein